MTRIGIIGTGELARIHIDGLLTAGNYEVTGCYSPQNSEAMSFARQYRLISYSSLHSLFQYTDVADITDDLPETAELAEWSLKAMKHVFVASPERLDMEQIQHLKKLSEESGVVLQLGTGYRYCPVYDMLAESMQDAKMANIRLQLVNSSDLYARLNTELSYVFDFVTGILKTGIGKIDVKTWVKSENLLHCRLECNSGCTVNVMAYTVAEGSPKLDITLTSSDAVIRADVFKSAVEKQYRTCDLADSAVLDAYSEKTVQKRYLTNFYHAVCGNTDAIRNIEEQFQNKAAAGYVVKTLQRS